MAAWTKDPKYRIFGDYFEAYNKTLSMNADLFRRFVETSSEIVDTYLAVTRVMISEIGRVNRECAYRISKIGT